MKLLDIKSVTEAVWAGDKKRFLLFSAIPTQRKSNGIKKNF